ncbi:MAG: protein-tyrosine-phosphatase [Flammeovirgaceae bacterium]
MNSSIFNPQLTAYLKEIEKNFDSISEERKTKLHELSQFISDKLKNNKEVLITFICTHNSRRSQFGQVWAKVAALYYGLDDQKVSTFSGGTEATACNPRTVEALKRAGIKIEKQNQISAPLAVADNPRYAVFLDEKKPASFFLFSKKYDAAENPQSGYAAVLVCSSADEACPIVHGAELRLYHGYEDPKVFDNTPKETEMYDERCKQIATELFYVFYKVKTSI